MYRTNKLNLALVVMLLSFPSNISIPNIVAVEFMKASRMLMLFDPFGYRWKIHNITDVKIHSKVRPSQSFQWKGAMKVVQENWSTFLSKLKKRIINSCIRDHPFKMPENFHNFWPLPSPSAVFYYHPLANLANFRPLPS